MKTSFESLLEKAIPEINFLSAAGAGLEPGHVLESLAKDIVIGYLPKYLKKMPVMKRQKFKLIEEPYDISLDKIEGTTSGKAAISVLKFLGLKYNKKLKYKIDFDLQEITSVKFADNLDKITFEIALSQLKKTDPESKSIFKRFKGHILVLRVLYATKYRIAVSVDKGSGYEADLEAKNVDIDGELKIKRKENTLLVSGNPLVPFGVIGYKIKGNKLKEVD